MKKTLWLYLSFMLFLVSCETNPNDSDSQELNIAQRHGLPTSLEEYNYVTKGYKIQLEAGLDMKKGYKLEDVDSANVTTEYESRSATLKKLIKVSEKRIVAYMLIYQKDGREIEYLCIPNPKSDKQILSLYWDALLPEYGESSERLRLITFLLSKKMVW